MIKNYLMKFYTPEGRSLIKNVKAESLLDAESIILSEGYMPSITLPNIVFDVLYPAENAGMKNNELSLFFSELYRLTKSTGSVSKALSYIDKETIKPSVEGRNKLSFFMKWLYHNHAMSKSKNRRKLIKDSIYLLNKGDNLREIFAIKNFDEIVLSLLDLAASTGDYPQAFLKISDYFSSRNIYRKKTIGTLAYPFFLFFLLLVAFAVFIYYVIPTFSLFFSQFPDIPASTKDVLKLFKYIKSIFIYLIFFLISIISAIGLNLFRVKTKIFSFIFSIPQIRNVINYGYLGWIFYQFSLMISAGITVNAIFNYFKNNVSKPYFRNKFGLIFSDLTKGTTLRDAIANANFLSEDIIDSIGYAEKGGFLSETVLRMSEEFKEKSERLMQLLTKGLFFLAMALVVSFLFLMFFSLFLPLIQGMVSLPANY